MSISLRVNGVSHSINAHPITPLVEILRDDLQLTGTKVGCSIGDCGACTVRLNNEQVCACIVSVGHARDADVLTVEGLANTALGAKLQHAFHALGAAQCGICTPGMLLAAFDVLSKHPIPTREMIRDGLAGVLCRCTGYQKIIEAIEHCARDSSNARTAPRGIIGDRLPKVDGIARVDGSAQFGADGIPANARWIRVIRSPHHRAQFTLGDLSAFAKQHGIDRVLTAADVPRNGFGIYPTIKDQPVFAQDEAKFRGEAICAFVGERNAVFAFADEALPIQWQPLEPIFGIARSEAVEARVHAQCADNILIDGGVRKNLAHPIDATVRAEVSVETAFVEHAYIEPEAGWATREGDRIHVRVSTQTPYMDRDEIASVMQLPASAIRLTPTACGGGFGGKLDMSVQPYLAVAAWLMPDRPVACVYTRGESMASTTKRHPAEISLTMSANASGLLQSCVSHAKFDTGAYASWGPTVATRVPIHATGPYFVPQVNTRGTAYYTHCHPSGAFRGFGVPQGALAHEAAMDALADQLRIDRLEFRLTNAIRVGQATATGQILKDSAGLDQCLRALKPRWDEWHAQVDAWNRNARTHRRGVGIGCMWYGIGNTSLSNPSTIRITLDRTGFTLHSGAVDIGQGSNTILTQIAAENLHVAAAQMRLVAGDTDLTFDAGKTSASRQTYVSGQATQRAARALLVKILQRAGFPGEIPTAQIKLSFLNLEFNASVLVTVGNECRELRLAFGDTLEGVGTFDPPTTPQDANGQGEPYACYAFAAQIALVEVDLELGTTKVLNVCAAHDVGRAINPTQVEGQIHGGILQGLGLALMEEYIPGRTENLHDYLIPTIGDMPEMEVILVEDPTALGPAGAKGVGEPGLIPTAPAILGAIEHATGVRMTRVPVLPHRLRAEIVKCAR